jgi:uncharacterized protein YjiS (DUF1127 family)
MRADELLRDIHELNRVEMIMSTQATAGSVSAYVGARPKTNEGKGWVQRTMDAFVAARMRTARATVARELGTLSDDHLKALGLSDADIKSLRQTGRLFV